MGQIAERYPQLRTPLATNDADGPIMRKLKFVLEDLGIGAGFDVGIMAFLPVAKTGLQQVGKATVKGTECQLVGGTKDLGTGLGKLRDEIIAANPEDLTGVGQQVRNVLDTDIDSLRSDFAEYTQSRRDSVEAQTRESVKAQLKEPGDVFQRTNQSDQESQETLLLTTQQKMLIKLSNRKKLNGVMKMVMQVL